MSNFSQYFSQAWSAVFHNKKSFFLLLLLMGGVSIITSGLFYAYWINVFSPDDVNLIFKSWKLLWIFFSFSLFSFLASFFGMLILVRIFKNKKIITREVLADWKRIFPYIGTLVCSALYYLLIFVGMLIVGGVIFGLGCIVYWGLPFILEWSHSVRLVLAITVLSLFALMCLTLFCVIVWFITSLFTFIIPAFFIDNHRYFSAALVSRKLVSGRWWKTFGNIFLVIVLFMIVMIIVAIGRFYLAVYSYQWIYLFIFWIIQTLIQAFVAIFLNSFLFSMYLDYKKHSIK